MSKLKKILSVFLVLTIVLVIVPFSGVTVFADDAVIDDSVSGDTNGDGAYVDPSLDPTDNPDNFLTVTSMEITSYPTKLQYIEGYVLGYVRYEGLEMKVGWSDGTYTDWSFNESPDMIGNQLVMIDYNATLETDKTVYIRCCDVETSYQIEVVPSPVESIEIVSGEAPVHIENHNGYIDPKTDPETGVTEEVFYYYPKLPTDVVIKINYKDGTSAEAKVYDQVGDYYVTWADNQYTTPWKTGTDNESVITYLGASVVLPVSVIGSGISEDGFKYCLYNNEAWVFGYTGENLDIVIPDSLEEYPVTHIEDRAFYNRNDLLSIELPSTLKTIGNEAFYGCGVLSRIDIPGSVESIGEGAFAECLSFVSVALPDSLTVIAPRLFYGCVSLRNVSFGNNVTTIGENAFYNCMSIRRFDLPESLTEIGSYAFSLCTGINSITIPKSVTELPEGVFFRCYGIDYVELYDTFELLGSNVFTECDELSDIYYYGTEEDWNNIYISINNDYLDNVTMHYSFFKLVDESCVVVDRVSNVMYGIDLETTVAEMKTQFTDSDNIVIVNKNGIELEDTDFIGVDCKVRHIGQDGAVIDEIATIVVGDTTGDGVLNVADAQIAYKLLMRITPLGGVYRVAADMDENGKLTVIDVMLMLNTLVA